MLSLQLLAGDAGLLLAGVAACAALLAASAFFSSTEIAMFSLAPHRVESLAADDRRGDTLAALREDPHRLLVTILVGNNLVNVAVSSIVTALLARYLAAGPAVLAATGVATVVVLVFGEILPKTYGVAHAEEWALTVARPLAVVGRVLAPIVIVFDAVTALATRFGGERALERPYVTREEIRGLLRTGERAGVIDEGESDLLEGVLELGRTQAGEVARDLPGLPRTATPGAALDACADTGLLRVPVRDEGGTVTGAVDVRAAARARDDEPDSAGLDALADPVFSAQAATRLDDLLASFRRRDARLAVLEDETGAPAGVVPVEDVVACVVGGVLDLGPPGDATPG